MKSWRSSILEDCATRQGRLGGRMPVAGSGFLNLITPHDLQELRGALAQGILPVDFEAKLTRLARGSLSDRYVEQSSRLIYALLQAAHEGSFGKATPSDRERLVRVLAYVRKEDDAIPDYLPSGLTDDQQEMRAATTELSPLLREFKVWRLRHQVPNMWWA
jgi:hypothetical protein